MGSLPRGRDGLSRGAPYSNRAESATSDFAQRRYVAALRLRFKEMFNTGA